MLPLETPSHPFPCNPIQGPREVGVCASMHWVGGVLLTKWHTWYAHSLREIITYSEDSKNQKKRKGDVVLNEKSSIK